jgi:CheY-like chemotaxis protein
MKNILCCKFKTTTLFTDDHSDLQTALSLHLPLNSGPYCFLNNSREALERLQKESPLLTGKHLNQDEFYRRANLDELKSYVNRSHKISKISVAFMDYQMPSLTGVEVFERANLPCTEKILLTAMTDEKIAIQAFNRGMINRYIHKNDPDLISLIKEAIEVGQKKYFQRSTQIIYSLVTQEEQETALTDPIFVRFFEDLTEKLKIEEHYLLDERGGFLMLDADKKRYKLDIYTKEQFQSFLQTQPRKNLPLQTISGRQIYHCILT